jgi:hypothetical protein
MKAAPIIVLASMAAFLPQTQQAEAQPKQVLPPGMPAIVAARDEHAGFVMRVKAKLKPEDKDYQTAEILYLKAASQYSAWIAAVKYAVIGGKQKDLALDPEYQKLTKTAEAAGKAFTDHAAKVTVTTKPVHVLKALFDAGVRFWDFCRKKKAEERTALADTFEQLAKWPRWDEIKAVSTPPAPAASPSPSASPSAP